MDNIPVLIVPGLGGSGPGHWQTLWAKNDPTLLWGHQRDWDKPDLAEWRETLHRHIVACAAAPVVVAHSLACSLVAHWARRYKDGIKAALLVSPSDVESPAHTPDQVRGFSPIPLDRLSFPSILVASTNDPRADFRRARFFAESWGSRFVSVTDAGHMNAVSGFGEWLEGKALLQELLQQAEHSGAP